MATNKTNITSAPAAKTASKVPQQPQPGPVDQQAGPQARPATLLRSLAVDAGAASRGRAMQSLQRTMGNTRVSRMLGTAVQPKLTVGAPNDAHEQATERMAAPVALGRDSGLRPIVQPHMSVEPELLQAKFRPDPMQEVNREVESGINHVNTRSYQPDSLNGEQLLSQRLNHTMQQLDTISGHPIQRQPDEPGLRAVTITVRWTDDDREFYHRVINAIARSKSYEGVEKASLWQPFYQPIFSLFHRLSTESVLLPGSSIRLRASAWFDPTVFHGQLTNASIETEQAALIRETKIVGVLTPQETFPDRGPTEVGPGAVIDLSFTSTPIISANDLGGLKWFVRSGGGTLTGGNDGKGIYTAGSSGHVQLELRIDSGFSAGKTVSAHLITVLAIKDMVMRDPDKPERLIISRGGLTPEWLAEYLYGDISKATAIWTVWDEKVRGEPWRVTTKIPVGMWIRFEYRYLKPEFKKIYDVSLDITSRKEWGAKPPLLGDPKREYEPYTVPLEDVIDSIVIHHAGNEGYKSMNEVQDLHMNEKEAADVGYHYGISLSGEVFEGRPINVKGAHVEGANTGKIGIVLLADLDPENKGMKWWQYDRSEDTLSPQMEASLLRLIHFLQGKYPKIKHLGGHNEFNKSRFCPGKKPMDKMSSWRSSTNLFPPQI